MATVHYGLSSAYIAKRNVASNGTVSYDTPVRLPGGVSLNVSKNSEVNNFYADNIVYFAAAAKTGVEIELEIADIPREFMLNYLGYMEATQGGIVETNAITDARFALLFAVETDTQQRKFCYYNCSATESDEEYTTIEDTVEPQTSTLTITNSGEAVGEVQVFKHVAEAGDDNYATFFTNVTIPTL